MKKIETYLEEFRAFVESVRKLLCGSEEKIISTGVAMEAEYDPMAAENREAIFKDGWSVMASIWAGVESIPAYLITMRTILEHFEKMDIPKGRKFRILSLGSGPALYETFLAYWFREQGYSLAVYPLDYAVQMVEFQRKILCSKDLRIGGKKLGFLKDDVIPTEGDMTDLSRFRGKIDVIICNNSLQWVADWQKAVLEMGLSMSPEGAKRAFMFIHPHAMRIRVGDMVLKREIVTYEALLDAMEGSHFSPLFQRYMNAGPGSGQSDREFLRMHIDLKFLPAGVERSWRKRSLDSATQRKISVAG